MEDEDDRALMDRALNDDDVAAADEIRRRCGGDDRRLAWMGCGDLAALHHRELVRAAGQNAFHREAIDKHVASLRDKLLGPAPTQLERLLVTRICATWIDLQNRERLANPGPVAMKLKILEHRCKMRDRAHRRYLDSIKALATLRKLQLPAVLMNITSEGGPQQVNVEPPGGRLP